MLGLPEHLGLYRRRRTADLVIWQVGKVASCSLLFVDAEGDFCRAYEIASTLYIECTTTYCIVLHLQRNQLISLLPRDLTR